MTNPILNDDELKFEIDSPTIPVTPNHNRHGADNPQFHIYNDYDNLNHPCLAKSNNALKDSTNLKKGRLTRVFRVRNNFFKHFCKIVSLIKFL